MHPHSPTLTIGGTVLKETDGLVKDVKSLKTFRKVKDGVDRPLPGYAMHGCVYEVYKHQLASEK